MGRFTSSATARYVPAAGVFATRECDTVVRMAQTSPAISPSGLRDMLTAAVPGGVRLVAPEDVGPHVWHERTMALDAVLRGEAAKRSPEHLLEAYADELETATLNLEHEFLGRPVATILGVWVGETDILAHLDAITPHALTRSQLNPAGSAAPSSSPYSTQPAPSASALTILPVLVILVARAGSRQDDAALLDAKIAIAERLGPGVVVVLRVGMASQQVKGKCTGSGNTGRQQLEEVSALAESVDVVAAVVAEFVRGSLQTRLRAVTAQAEKARSAVKSSFKSWFGGVPSIRQQTVQSTASSIFSFTSQAAFAGASDSTNAIADTISEPAIAELGSAAARPGDARSINGASFALSSRASTNDNLGPSSRAARRNSIGSGAASSTPLFPVDSAESLSRYAADLLMLAGEFESAGDAYRVLATDISGLPGPSLVHEASVLELAAIALALADGSKREVGKGLERAIKIYSLSGRRELAVRAALRAADYCFDAGFPESAAGVLDRALLSTFPVPLFLSSNTLSSSASVASASIISAPASGALSTSVSRSTPSSLFSESAASVLLARTAFMFARMGRRRKATLYAFLSATRLSGQSLHAAAALIARDIDSSALTWSGISNEVELLYGRAETITCFPERAIPHFTGVMAGSDDTTDVEVQSRAILGMFEAVEAGAVATMAKRWDSGASYPIADAKSAIVCTVDRVVPGGDECTTRLDDEILEDCEYFENLFCARTVGSPSTPKRSQSVEKLIADLRRDKASGVGLDPGGSLEMKIQRMRDAAATAARKRRARSLLDRGAVVGEIITLTATLHNPLQFPVFMSALSAVVTLSGQLYDRNSKSNVIFLPTVSDIVLMPLSRHDVSVCAIPHKSGPLRFVGIQWLFTIGRSASPNNASTAAPGFCVLERRGPRLNGTRKQRASETPLYAEDMSLAVDVIPPAPRLHVSFDEIDDVSQNRESGSKPRDVGDQAMMQMQLRAGEKQRRTIAITNRGLHAVDRIFIRTGTPQLIFLDAAGGRGVDVEAFGQFEHVDEEDASTRKVDRSVVLAGCFSMHLAPGDCARQTVWVLGSGSGKSVIRVAVAYGADRIRVTRLACEVTVVPSIVAFPRFIRRLAHPLAEVIGSAKPPLDFSSPEEAYLLGIEIEHSGQKPTTEKFQMVSISVSSQAGWQVYALPGLNVPAACAHLVESAPRNLLAINETATIFLILSLSPGLVRQKGQAARTSAAPEHMSNRSISLVSPPIDAITDDSGQAESESGKRASAHFCTCAGMSERASQTGSPLLSASSVLAAASPFPFRTSSSTSFSALYTTIVWHSSSGCCGEVYLAPLVPSDWVDKADDDAVTVGNTKLDADAHTANIDGQLGMEERLLKELEDARSTPVFNSVSRRMNSRCDSGGGPPLEIHIVHKKKIQHKFTNAAGHTGPMMPAVVPVDVYLRNISSELVDAVISAPVAGGIADGDRGRFWGGLVDASLRSIPPGTERRVCLSAILDGPGMFDLGKLTTVVRRRGNTAGPSNPAHVLVGHRSGSTTVSRDMSVSGPKSSLILCMDSRTAVPIESDRVAIEVRQPHKERNEELRCVHIGQEEDAQSPRQPAKLSPRRRRRHSPFPSPQPSASHDSMPDANS
jgi:ER-Golgi trafficking TRAPP I complex 85 kDa subunit